jgi:Subtilase family
MQSARVVRIVKLGNLILKLKFVLSPLFVLLLSMPLVVVATCSLSLSNAWADDDDDGGGEGGAAGSSYGSGGSNADQTAKKASKRYSRQNSKRASSRYRKSPKAQAKSGGKLPGRASREIVILAYSGNAKQVLLGKGYVFLEERSLTVQPNKNIAKLRIPRKLSLEEARRDVQSVDVTSPVDFNHFYRPVLAENCADPQCAALQSVGWTAETDRGCSLSPTIGFVETSIDLEHTHFNQKSVRVVPLRTAGNKPSGAAHGTAVVSLLYNDKNTRTPGLLPNAKVIVANPYHVTEGGDERTDVYDLVRAIDYLVSQKPDVINLSLAGPDNDLLRNVIGDAYQTGVPVVAAVGNASSQTQIYYPAGYATVVAVTAVDAKGKVFRRANRGQHIDFAAPGVELWGAASGSGYKKYSGTSFAAPFVSAAIGMMRVRAGQAKQEELVAKLKRTSRDLGNTGPDNTFGHGLVQFTDLCK